MTECLACREGGESAPATYIVTFYVGGGEEQVQPSCDMHAMVLAVNAIARRRGVWAMTASRRNVPMGGGPGGTTGAIGRNAGTVAQPAGLARSLARAYLRIRRALARSGT